MSLDGQRIGFIGAGAMAEALVAGLRAAGIPGANLWAADPDPSRCKRLADRHQVQTTDDNAVVVTHSDVMVIAVKPAVVAPALAALASNPDVVILCPTAKPSSSKSPSSCLMKACAAGSTMMAAMPVAASNVGSSGNGLIRVS